MSDMLTKVTEEQFAAIRVDLEKLLEVGQKDGEALEVYALRLAKRASDGNVVSDEDWETLDEQTQKWVNGMLDADEKGRPLVLPPAVEGNGKDAPAPKDPKEKPAASAKEAKTKAAPAKPAKKAEKKAATAVTPKAPPKTKDAATRRGRPGQFAQDAKIKVLAKENPKRPKSAAHKRFAKYKDGMTVAEAIKAGIQSTDLRYDTAHDYIRVG